MIYNPVLRKGWCLHSSMEKISTFVRGTVEPPIKDPQNKGHNRNSLSTSRVHVLKSKMFKMIDF